MICQKVVEEKKAISRNWLIIIDKAYCFGVQFLGKGNKSLHDLFKFEFGAVSGAEFKYSLEPLTPRILESFYGSVPIKTETHM